MERSCGSFSRGGGGQVEETVVGGDVGVVGLPIKLLCFQRCSYDCSTGSLCSERCLVLTLWWKELLWL